MFSERSKPFDRATRRGNSITVFTRFIKYNEDEIDVSGLLSIECYQLWLSTRKEIPKDSPHAFRKAVTGHVRGDHGLNPFPREVEEALIILLRQKKVWPCFEGTGKKIGSRGFQTLGYWERHGKGEESNERVLNKRKSDEDNVSETISISDSLAGSVDSSTEWSSSSSTTSSTNQVATSPKHKKLKQSEKQTTTSYQSLRYEQIVKLERNECFKRFLEAYKSYISQDPQMLLLTLSQQSGFKSFVTEVANSKAHETYEKHLEFVFVKELDQFFAKQETIGTIILDSLSFCVVKESENIKKIFNRSIISNCLLNVLKSKDLALCFIPEILKLLYLKGEAWFRMVISRPKNENLKVFVRGTKFCKKFIMLEICECNENA